MGLWRGSRTFSDCTPWVTQRYWALPVTCRIINISRRSWTLYCTWALPNVAIVKCSDLATRRDENAHSLTDSHPPLSPSNVYAYLSNLYYARRTKMNPLWNAILVGGYDQTKKERYVIYHCNVYPV
jgi:hypothetical protein